jgi:NAD(P)-dependent dehydrogenase (short-subunit alcohol dehydrogenase family)
MAIRIVTVVGASGTLGSEIVRALLEKGARVYVSHESQKQKDLFGELPTIEDSVARYCRDRGRLKPTAS